MNLELTVNGTAINREVDENRTLLRFLREELGLVGTKNGCEVGHCGSCTVLVDGEAKRSCLLKLGRLWPMTSLIIIFLGQWFIIQSVFLI